MKTFLEVKQVSNEPVANIQSNPVRLAVEVTGKTDKEITDLQTTLEEQMLASGYKVQLHYCYHEEHQLCTVKTLKEV